jgi:hypothetical protein
MQVWKQNGDITVVDNGRCFIYDKIGLLQYACLAFEIDEKWMDKYCKTLTFLELPALIQDHFRR